MGRLRSLTVLGRPGLGAARTRPVGLRGPPTGSVSHCVDSRSTEPTITKSLTAPIGSIQQFLIALMPKMKIARRSSPQSPPMPERMLQRPRLVGTSRAARRGSLSHATGAAALFRIRRPRTRRLSHAEPGSKVKPRCGAEVNLGTKRRRPHQPPADPGHATSPAGRSTRALACLWLERLRWQPPRR
jgi:hypothetical protein